MKIDERFQRWGIELIGEEEEAMEKWVERRRGVEKKTCVGKLAFGGFVDKTMDKT